MVKLKSPRINSRKRFRELLEKYRYFTLEFEGYTYHQDGTIKLVSESYRISKRFKEDLINEIPILKEAKRILFFEDLKQAKNYIVINLNRSLPIFRSSWLPIIIAIALSDTCLYYGHRLMEYWRDAKISNDIEGKEFYALAKDWMTLYNYCKDIREQFTKL